MRFSSISLNRPVSFKSTVLCGPFMAPVITLAASNWILSSISDSPPVHPSQTTLAYSKLDRTRDLYKVSSVCLERRNFRPFHMFNFLDADWNILDIWAFHEISLQSDTPRCLWVCILSITLSPIKRDGWADFSLFKENIIDLVLEAFILTNHLFANDEIVWKSLLSLFAVSSGEKTSSNRRVSSANKKKTTRIEIN